MPTLQARLLTVTLKSAAKPSFLLDYAMLSQNSLEAAEASDAAIQKILGASGKENLEEVFERMQPYDSAVGVVLAHLIPT